MKRELVILTVVCICALCSCKALGDLLHDGDIAAEVGTHKLYREQLESLIPVGLSPEDSASFATQYIMSWATEQLYQDVAADQLSKEEKDVTRELEAYRSSLLKYRYEQRYVNERLDTTVSHTEIEEYYAAHKDLFVLDAPVLKARFLDIMQDSPNKDVIKKKMSSDKYEDLAEADSLSYSSALRYVDYSESWTDARTLASEFDTDYGTMLSRQSGSYIEIPQARGDVMIAYVLSTIKAGSPAPLEYCEDRIRDIIISGRKRALLSTLEQDLLNDALLHDKLKIYKSDE